MQAIVICTVNNPGISVLLESLAIYAPDLPVYISSTQAITHRSDAIWLPNMEKNFGDAYNAAVNYAFKDGYQSIIMANDDVVITPTTLKLMREDLDRLNRTDMKIGFVGARSDYVLPDQNIRFPLENDKIVGLRYDNENYIKNVEVIAPIFAAISKEAWDVAQFPSINWYSDNIICDDLTQAGYSHFVSRAYVHHAGSQTVGTDFKLCHEEPRAWIKANRPDKYKEYYG